MDEDPKEPEQPAGLPAPASDETPKPINSIDKANEAIEKMKAENDRQEALQLRAEALHSEKILSGKADAGQVPEPPKEETAEEYKDRIMRGDLNEKEEAAANRA